MSILHFITKVGLVALFGLGLFLSTDVEAAETGTCLCNLTIQQNPDSGQCVYPTVNSSGLPTSDSTRTFKIDDTITFRKLFEDNSVKLSCPALTTQILFSALNDTNDPPIKITKTLCSSGKFGSSIPSGDTEYVFLLESCKYTAPPKAPTGGGGSADSNAGGTATGTAAGTNPAQGTAKPNVNVFATDDPNCNSVCQWIKQNYGKPEGYKGPIPDCAFSGQCRDVNDLVQFFINQGKVVFGLIGTLALGAFIYGGILMVFSFGSSEKVSQGKEVMVAAVVGLIIVFSAYIGVSFVLRTVGVNPELQAIK